jgi:hypothetical protein
MHANDWQDIILAISFAAFNVALIPSVVGKKKPAFYTSLLTATFLVPGLIVYINLSLWYSAIMTAINIGLWVTLLIQEYRLSKQKS